MTILAERGFADQTLFTFLTELGFDDRIGIRGHVPVTAAEGEQRPAAEWVGAGGRARKRAGVSVTAAARPIGAVVCVQAKRLTEPWGLVASTAAATAGAIINRDARRGTIAPSFRDTQDLRFGLGLGSLPIRDPDRRNRPLLLNALAILFLTGLGAAGESLGLDRHLKVNTAKRRTQSLFRQGGRLDDLIPTMPEIRLLPRIQKFADRLQQKVVTSKMLSKPAKPVQSGNITLNRRTMSHPQMTQICTEDTDGHKASMCSARCPRSVLIRVVCVIGVICGGRFLRLRGDDRVLLRYGVSAVTVPSVKQALNRINEGMHEGYCLLTKAWAHSSSIAFYS